MFISQIIYYNMDIFNRSVSSGLYIHNQMVIRRFSNTNTLSPEYSTSIIPIQIDGTTVTYSVQNTNPTWGIGAGSLSFWILFNSNNFSNEQTILNLFSGGGASLGVNNRWFKSTSNEIIVRSTGSGNITGTFSSGIILSPNTLYHFVINISETNVYSPAQSGFLDRRVSSRSNFMLNGDLHFINRVSYSGSEQSAMIDRISEISNPTIGDSTSNFNIFDIVYTPDRLNLNQANYLYNSGHGVDLKQIMDLPPFSNGFVFNDLTLRRPLRRDYTPIFLFSNNSYDGVYLDYLNNSLTTPKEVYDNAVVYQPTRNGNSFNYGGTIFPISNTYIDYFHEGTNNVVVNGFTISLDEELSSIPDNIDTIRFINCTFLNPSSSIGETIANYTSIEFTNCSGQSINLFGSKKNYRLTISGCTFSNFNIERLGVNLGVCSFTNNLRGNSPNLFSINSSRIDNIIFGSSSAFSNMVNARFDDYEFNGEFRIEGTPNNFFYTIQNTERFGDGIKSIRLENNNIISENNLSGGIENGNFGISSSISTPLSFSSSTFLTGISLSSRNMKYLILPNTSCLRVLTITNVDVTSSDVLNLSQHSSTLRKFEHVNFDTTKPFGSNMDFSSFSNLQVLVGYFSGSLTLPSSNNLLILHSNRNMTSDRSGQGSTGHGLTTVSRLATSLTSIRLSGHTTLSDIGGDTIVRFGGRTNSIQDFSLNSSLLQGIEFPTASNFQFTSTFDVSNSNNFDISSINGLTQNMFPNNASSVFNISNTIHTGIDSTGLKLGTVIRSRNINISSTNGLQMGLTALVNSVESMYNNWFNFFTSSVPVSRNQLTWNHPGVTQTSGLTPSGFTLGVSDGTFSSDILIRVRELKHVLTTQQISVGNTASKYNWTFTP